MKKLFTLICAAGLGLAATAQRQIQNPGFEEWENEGSNLVEPAHWNSFMSGSGSLKSYAAAQQVEKSTDAHTGSASARIYARSVFGVVAQGNLTTGCINMGSINATDANGNYNYTSESDAAFHQQFTGLPDAMRLWVKGACQDGAGASCNLHTAGYFQDPAGNTITATRIGKADKADIAAGDTWQEVIIPFTYDVTDGTRPAYALVTVTTCGTPGGGNAADWLLIDDVAFLYYSDLRGVTFNGQDIPVSGTTVKIDGTYDASLLELRSGQGATITSSYNQSAKTLTVSIKGEDIAENPANQHTYTLVFSGTENQEPQPEPGPQPATDDIQGSLVPGGDFEAWKAECGTTLQNGRGGGEYKRPGTEPEGWNGSSLNFNTILVTNDFHTATLVEQVAGYDSNSAVKVTNKSVSSWGNKFTFPGFVTYGDLWLWSGVTNYSNTDCGVYGGRAYNKRPDAIRGHFRRPSGTTEDAHIIAYLWKGTFKSLVGSYDAPSTEFDDVERAIMGHTAATGGNGQLIASCDYSFKTTKDGGWEAITVPLTYAEGQEESVPEKMNIILSGGDYWSRSIQEGNSLEADNVEFLFYSELATATYNGQPITFDADRHAVVDADYDQKLLTLSANGRSARIVKSYDETTRTLTILVKGGDYDTNIKNSHTYKVEFLEQHKVVAEQTYKDLILISINDAPGEPKEATITIQQWNTGEYTLVLPNFIMGESYNVGTIVVTPVEVKADGTFAASQNITIQPGDTPADAQWIGPMLGEVPIDMEGRLTQDSLHVRIQIDLMARMNQNISVLFGKSLIDSEQQGTEPGPEPQPGPGDETIELKGTHTYTDDLTVTINGEATAPQKTDIIVTFNTNNTLDLSLNNFRLQQGNEDMPVGNIEVKNVKFSLRSGVAYATFSKSETITIAAGDSPADALWMGPMLGDIPVKIAGKAGTDKLYCTIDIEMTGVGSIHVDFGIDADWPQVQGGGTEPVVNDILRDHTFHDILSVSVNGVTSQPAENEVEMRYSEDDEAVTLIIHNFKLLLRNEDGSEELAPVGNIEISGIQPVEVPGKGYYQFMSEQTIQIKEGDDSENAWIGPYLGDVPLEISGKISREKLYCAISIYMATLGENGQNIRVIFGENYTDGIATTASATTADKRIFTLGGQRVGHVTKPGLYIIGGKKVLVR